MNEKVFSIASEWLLKANLTLIWNTKIITKMNYRKDNTRTFQQLNTN